MIQSVKEYLISIGFIQTHKWCFEIENEHPYNFNHARVIIFGKNRLSIRADKKDRDYSKELIKGFYFKDKHDIEFLLKRMVYLGSLLPQIVDVPDMIIEQE